MVPALEKLKKDKEAYMEWKKASADSAALQQVVQAHTYWKMHRNIGKIEEACGGTEDHIEGLEGRKIELQVRSVGSAYRIRLEYEWHSGK
jgi:chromosome segregation ATPase